MTKYYSNALVKNIYRINSGKSEITSQILYGEKFFNYFEKGKWLKIRTSFDNYIGFIKNDKYSKNKKITHKCYNLKSRIYRTDKSGRFLKTKFFYLLIVEYVYLILIKT